MPAGRLLVPALTATQTMILYLMAKRLPMSDIAGKLHLTEKGVRTEFSQALRKLKSRNLRLLFGQTAERT